MIIVFKKIDQLYGTSHDISCKQTLYNHQVRIPWHIDFQLQPVLNQIVRVGPNH